MEKTFEEETVLKVLALALPNETPGHRVRYLLQKLYGKDSLGLDTPNQNFYEEIVKIAEDI